MRISKMNLGLRPILFFKLPTKDRKSFCSAQRTVGKVPATLIHPVTLIVSSLYDGLYEFFFFNVRTEFLNYVSVYLTFYLSFKLL